MLSQATKQLGNSNQFNWFPINNGTSSFAAPQFLLHCSVVGSSTGHWPFGVCTFYAFFAVLFRQLFIPAPAQAPLQPSHLSCFSSFPFASLSFSTVPSAQVCFSFLLCPCSGVSPALASCLVSPVFLPPSGSRPFLNIFLQRHHGLPWLVQFWCTVGPLWSQVCLAQDSAWPTHIEVSLQSPCYETPANYAQYTGIAGTVRSHFLPD